MQNILRRRPPPARYDPANMTNLPHIGILGSGQLARMLALAAVPLGVRVSVLEKRPSDTGMGWRAVTGDWDDPTAAAAFARSVDVVTLENEFVQQVALEAIAATGTPLYPTPDNVRLVQDKLLQKQTLAATGLPVPAFSSELNLPLPIVLKKRRMGYDGKGNATARTPAEYAAGVARLGDGLYAEAFCPFERELAVMVTRGRSGEAVCYPVVETAQHDHICRVVQAPADLSPALRDLAERTARRAVEAFGGIGTWGVEMFLTREGDILVNELAPRVHNSGHYTIEACACSQFENHIRAILGWPLGSPALRAPAAAMVNLLGVSDGPRQPKGLFAALAIPGAHIHIYGKDRSARGRKMGHVTALGATPAAALTTAQRAADALRFGS